MLPHPPSSTKNTGLRRRLHAAIVRPLMIEQSRHPLEVVARETGLRDRPHLREVFTRRFGVSPQATRRSARV